MDTGTSLTSLIHQRKIGQTELGDQKFENIKIEDLKIGF
jgi:hypothetical protein